MAILTQPQYVQAVSDINETIASSPSWLQSGEAGCGDDLRKAADAAKAVGELGEEGATGTTGEA